jgi:hypothetical protein
MVARTINFLRPHRLPLCLAFCALLCTSKISFAQATLPNPPSFDPAIYALIDDWKPGRSDATRQWIMLASGFVVIALVAIRLLLWRWRGSAIIVLCAGVLMTAGLILFPVTSDSASQKTITRANDIVVFIASPVPTRISEPIIGDLRFVPASPGHLEKADPKVETDVSGARSISVSIGPGYPACFIRSLR